MPAAPTRACVLRAAAEVARAIPARNNDFDETANLLSRVSDAQSAAGLNAEAAATIDEALRIATPLNSTYAHDDALREIAGVLARAGRFGEAVDAAGSIRNTYFQPEAIGDIAIAEGRVGRLDDALQRVRTIENPSNRAYVIRRLAWDMRADAVARADDDKLVMALTEVVAIEEKYPRPSFTSGVHHPSEFPPALAIIAEAQARAGRIEDAMAMARQVAGRERAEAFGIIASALAQDSAIASALNVARAVEDQEERGRVLDAILDPRRMPGRFPGENTGRSSVKAEAPNETVRVLPTFSDSSQRATALAIVAAAFASAGSLAKAVELAEAIDEGKPRVFAWHAVAVAQAKAGLTAESTASFDRAAQAALSFEPRDRLLSKIAVSQAEAGQIDDALRVTELIGGAPATAGYLATVNGANTDYERRYALRAISKAQAKAGRTAEAKQNAQFLVKGPDVIPPGRGVVAEALAEAGRIDDAIAAAVLEDNVYWRSELLMQIAKARAAAGRIDEAKQVAQHVTEGPDRAAALTAVAAAQVKAGLTADAMATFTETMRIAHALRYGSRSADALIAIATSLP